MSNQPIRLVVSLAFTVLLSIAGCGGPENTGPKKTPPSKQQASHPPHGPNDGHVFELEAEGGQHLHVEIVEDDNAKKVTAVLLGEDMKKEVQSSATEATLETSSATEKKSFSLKAETKGAPASRYSSTEEALLEAIEAPGAKITFHVEVDGKRYKADVRHLEH